MYPIGTPLSHFVIQEQQRNPGATGEFSRLLHHMVLGAKVVANAVGHAGLVDVLGETDGENASGDVQKKLDVYAHDRFVDHLLHSGLIALMGSEEEDHAILVPPDLEKGRYLVTMDPLDGSSNIDCNVSVGTIFSVFDVPDNVDLSDNPDQLLLRKGSDQIAAGYVLYGPSTILCLTTGNGVNAFTLDSQVGEFFLTHPDIRIPERGRIYAINEGNTSAWERWTADYIASLKGTDNGCGMPYTHRYVGSLVADAHRTLLYGGIFLYPGDRNNPRGKLRTLYEAFPMAFLTEQAGGAATDGHQRILDLTPTELHERIPLVLGSRLDVEDAARFLMEAV